MLQVSRDVEQDYGIATDAAAAAPLATAIAERLDAGNLVYISSDDRRATEIAAIVEAAAQHGSRAILCRHWAEGGAGAVELADAVAEICETHGGGFAPIYGDELSLFDKIDTVARRIYRAEHAVAEPSVLAQLKRWEDAGYGHLPVCLAKTQYSFSTDPALLGAPTGHIVPIREVRLAAGAGFVVAICGEIMTMPGLPRVPAAEAIRLNEDGLIEGLF